MVKLSRNKEKVKRTIVEEITKSVTCDFCGFTGEAKGFEHIEWNKRLPIDYDSHWGGERKVNRYVFDMCSSCQAKMEKGLLGTNLGHTYVYGSG